jgi:sulfite reductase (NADPH) flavoprotein alpha-component
MAEERGRWLEWAFKAVGLASGATAAYFLVRGPVSAKHAKQPGVLVTDFDSFLVAPGDAPTGNTSAANANKKKKLGKPGEWGPFEEFLKAAEEEEDHRDPLVFDSFLKTAIPGAAQPSKLRAAAPPVLEERPSPDMAKVAVIYGTEFGFSKEIAEKLATAMKGTKKLW